MYSQSCFSFLGQVFMYCTIHVFYLCFQYMGSPYKRSISFLGTTSHTIQIMFLICCPDLYLCTCMCMFGCDQWRSQEFVPGGSKFYAVWGTEVPQRGPGWSSGGGMGVKPPRS